MKYRVTGIDKIEGNIYLPASKSISNRALILDALSYSPYGIDNLSRCDDTDVMVKAFESDSNVFDIKAAGTAMRFLTAFLSKIIGEWVITGTDRMKNRPIRILVDALNSIGARIEYMEKEGYPPLKIYGSALQGGEIELDGGVSSQYISALLMVAPTMEHGLVLRLKGNVISKPYIALTLSLMKRFGVDAEWNENTITIAPQTYKPIPFKVESDWSAASYWYQMAALAKEANVFLVGLESNSAQGDSKVATLFEQLGVQTNYEEGGVVLTKTGMHCKRFEHDFVNEPDLAQTFVVTCCMLNVPFRFTGLQSLKIKETDRIEALKNELLKFGYKITDHEDSILEWNGERVDVTAVPVVKTYEDHRMAMAFAPIALLGETVWVDEPGVVSKSYPEYWDHLKQVGFNVEE
ncbi:MAG: 3-phosphoshikimate 1-carboxyvinyltransferase [Tannerellaceae bacterium]